MARRWPTSTSASSATACWRATRGQGDARPAARDLWYRNIIEPNAWGADAVRAAFWEAVQADG